VTETPAAARNPRRVALLTALGWNLVPVILLAIGIAEARSQRDDGGEDWSGLVAVILLVLGGGFVAVAVSIAAVIAHVWTGRRLHAAAAGGSPVTTGRAVYIGSLAALAGVGVAALAVTLFIAVTNGTIG
jgi:hypothetical protein